MVATCGSILGYSSTERTELDGCGISFLIKGEITEDDASKFTKLINWSDELYKRGKGGVPHVCPELRRR